MGNARGGQIGNDWNVAEVSRPLHAVSQVTGAIEHPTGKRLVLFNSKTCVAVPPRFADRFLKHGKPTAEYARDGNLYLATMTVSDFHWQGLGA